MSGHAIEARIYAEDPENDFLPQIGKLHDFHIAAETGIRLDSGVGQGDEVSIHYDPMLAKLCAHGATRDEANRRLMRALDGASVLGVTTNVPFLRAVTRHEAWQAGRLSTHFIADYREALRGRVLDPTLAARIATVVLAVGDDRQRTLLPDLPLGWRNNRFADPSTRFRLGATELMCEQRALGRACFRTVIAGVVVEIRVLDEADLVWRLEVDGRVYRTRVVVTETEVYVHADGAEVRLERVPRFVSALAKKDVGSCKAPMPGKIVAVRVAAGDQVEAGPPLVVVEAMKMEHTLEAPAAGVVAEVLVQAGEVVQADAELVKLDVT